MSQTNSAHNPEQQIELKNFYLIEDYHALADIAASIHNTNGGL